MRIPPPVIAVTMAVATVMSSGHMTRAWPANGYASCAALALALLGTAVDLSAKRLFVRQGTTVNPMSPGAASVMVSTGAYQWSRNPMYLGRLMQLLALALYLASPVGLLGVPLFAIYLDRVQIRAEERALSQRFPVEFAAYRLRVRRWL
ncbi:methyltransferase family protein [Dyella japonica]|uniref:Protein-S-isoprenylcysteine methyltransferase n=1 Tax=Dyella japonica A8 TaxID=1217721 RepID=A0A075JZV6_9GAMM|nr:isoprenylcysteine carboxylmethyltransferase family protein [Dyella japonica]AIF47601.1 hypothetical protein HY57_10145 [Dyella japonica A8]